MKTHAIVNKSMSVTSRRLLVLIVIVTILAVIYFILSRTGTLQLLRDSSALKKWIQHLGVIGPITIVGLMTMAIVISPIPSAPIALAAGAVYGHTTGTIYVAIGSELGAVIAFLIARLAGIEFVNRWAGEEITKRLHGSQNTLMTIVFVTRLLPFISFDVISYAAGITPLRFWRFAIATFAGILPASFLLAHFGSELASGESQRIGLTVFLLSIASLSIILIEWLSSRDKK